MKLIFFSFLDGAFDMIFSFEIFYIISIQRQTEAVLSAIIYIHGLYRSCTVRSLNLKNKMSLLDGFTP